MSTSFSQATLESSDAAKAFQLADAKINLDRTLFVEWALAQDGGEDDTAIYLEQELFSFELGTAFDEWVDMGDGRPPTPFDLESYVIEEIAVGEAADEAANTLFAEATDANQTGDNYVLVTVILASALFFAGISTVLAHERLRFVFVVAAGALLVGAVGTMLTFPIE